MTDLETAARLALDALEEVFDRGQCELTYLQGKRAITALRAALAQQAEPVVPMDAEIVHFAKTALHEMPRPATDWHHCAKRVCEAVVASRQQAEPVAEAAALAHIASLSHEGGLIGLSQWECLVEIRRLSLPYASLTGGPRDVKARLDAALIAASQSGQQAKSETDSEAGNPSY